MKLSLITPCFNAEKHIVKTLDSVQLLSARKDIELEYLIVDGNSSDGTLEKIRSFEKYGFISRVISEPDRGMYDALAKGLKLATGDIVGYLNAGDVIFTWCGQVLSEVFSHASVKWLTGINTIMNEAGAVTHCQLPFRYKNKLIQTGVYGRYLPYIQQESTFWRRELLSTIDYESLREYRLAGDYYLWFTFSKIAELYVVNSQLGGFTIHAGQLSENKDRYLNELQRMGIDKTLDLNLRLETVFERICWYLPLLWKRKFRLNRIICWNHLTSSWDFPFSD